MCFSIEVIVGGGVVLDCVIFRGVSDVPVMYVNRENKKIETPLSI